MKASHNLHLSTIVKQSPDQVNTDLDGDTIIMNIQNGCYFSLDDISTEIWELIANPIEIYRVCEMLVSEYDVAREQCEKEVLSFLDALNQEGLLSIDQEG